MCFCCKGWCHGQHFTELAHEVTLAGSWLQCRMTPSQHFSSFQSEDRRWAFPQLLRPLTHKLQEPTLSGFPWGILDLEFGSLSCAEIWQWCVYIHAGKISCALQSPLHIYMRVLSCLWSVQSLPPHPGHLPYFS